MGLSDYFFGRNGGAPPGENLDENQGHHPPDPGSSQTQTSQAQQRSAPQLNQATQRSWQQQMPQQQQRKFPDLWQLQQQQQQQQQQQVRFAAGSFENQSKFQHPLELPVCELVDKDQPKVQVMSERPGSSQPPQSEQLKFSSNPFPKTPNNVKLARHLARDSCKKRMGVARPPLMSALQSNRLLENGETMCPSEIIPSRQSQDKTVADAVINSQLSNQLPVEGKKGSLLRQIGKTTQPLATDTTQEGLPSKAFAFPASKRVGEAVNSALDVEDVDQAEDTAIGGRAIQSNTMFDTSQSNYSFDFGEDSDKKHAVEAEDKEEDIEKKDVVDEENDEDNGKKDAIDDGESIASLPDTITPLQLDSARPWWSPPASSNSSHHASALTSTSRRSLSHQNQISIVPSSADSRARVVEKGPQKISVIATKFATEQSHLPWESPLADGAAPRLHPTENPGALPGLTPSSLQSPPSMVARKGFTLQQNGSVVASSSLKSVSRNHSTSKHGGSLVASPKQATQGADPITPCNTSHSNEDESESKPSPKCGQSVLKKLSSAKKTIVYKIKTPMSKRHRSTKKDGALSSGSAEGRKRGRKRGKTDNLGSVVSGNLFANPKWNASPSRISGSSPGQSALVVGAPGSGSSGSALSTKNRITLEVLTKKVKSAHEQISVIQEDAHLANSIYQEWKASKEGEIRRAKNHQQTVLSDDEMLDEDVRLAIKSEFEGLIDSAKKECADSLKNAEKTYEEREQEVIDRFDQLRKDSSVAYDTKIRELEEALRQAKDEKVKTDEGLQDETRLELERILTSTNQQKENAVSKRDRVVCRLQEELDDMLQEGVSTEEAAKATEKVKKLEKELEEGRRDFNDAMQKMRDSLAKPIQRMMMHRRKGKEILSSIAHCETKANATILCSSDNPLDGMPAFDEENNVLALSKFEAAAADERAQDALQGNQTEASFEIVIVTEWDDIEKTTSVQPSMELRSVVDFSDDMIFLYDKAPVDACATIGSLGIKPCDTVTVRIDVKLRFMALYSDPQGSVTLQVTLKVEHEMVEVLSYFCQHSGLPRSTSFFFVNEEGVLEKITGTSLLLRDLWRLGVNVIYWKEEDESSEDADEVKNVSNAKEPGEDAHSDNGDDRDGFGSGENGDGDIDSFGLSSNSQTLRNDTGSSGSMKANGTHTDFGIVPQESDQLDLESHWGFPGARLPASKNTGSNNSRNSASGSEGFHVADDSNNDDEKELFDDGSECGGFPNSNQDQRKELFDDGSECGGFPNSDQDQRDTNLSTSGPKQGSGGFSSNMSDIEAEMKADLQDAISRLQHKRQDMEALQDTELSSRYKEGLASANRLLETDGTPSADGMVKSKRKIAAVIAAINTAVKDAESLSPCPVCGGLVGPQHLCKLCKNNVHLPECSIAAGEEGYGQPRICLVCRPKQDTTDQMSQRSESPMRMTNDSDNEEGLGFDLGTEIVDESGSGFDANLDTVANDDTIQNSPAQRRWTDNPPFPLERCVPYPNSLRPVAYEFVDSEDARRVDALKANSIAFSEAKTTSEVREQLGHHKLSEIKKLTSRELDAAYAKLKGKQFKRRKLEGKTKTKAIFYPLSYVHSEAFKTVCDDVVASFRCADHIQMTDEEKLKHFYFFCGGVSMATAKDDPTADSLLMGTANPRLLFHGKNGPHLNQRRARYALQIGALIDEDLDSFYIPPEKGEETSI